ncbi:hypothetical protein DERF_003775 [Dermatophagoides farinae]|uniref:HSF-type DNA-binding domain-containing protein n=1 Tax=Dermatophagoides farinae TaxID=6954 RepID=A0A922IEE8_DERFA|nr:hypothetical protein DERF_003775 [Dermatophagoides farinae]
MAEKSSVLGPRIFSLTVIHSFIHSLNIYSFTQMITANKKKKKDGQTNERKKNEEVIKYQVKKRNETMLVNE